MDKDFPLIFCAFLDPRPLRLVVVCEINHPPSPFFELCSPFYYYFVPSPYPCSTADTSKHMKLSSLGRILIFASQGADQFFPTIIPPSPLSFIFISFFFSLLIRSLARWVRSRRREQKDSKDKKEKNRKYLQLPSLLFRFCPRWLATHPSATSVCSAQSPKSLSVWLGRPLQRKYRLHLTVAWVAT